jgi:ubiquinone/menaquinone biosynthesis C-methylase UbiE
MERLAGVRELLDGPLDDPESLRGNLRDLRRINRLTGGVDLSIKAVDALADGTGDLRLVDVGTGGADIPVALLADARRRGRRLHVTGIDSREEVLDAARTERPALTRITDLTLELADGTSLPYPDRSFDIAHASLVLHHLEPTEAVTFLRELARVARRGIVVNDLARGRRFVAGAWVLTRLTTCNRYTRADAVLSVRRSYTMAEARALLADVGLAPTFAAHAPFRHRWVLAATRPS